MSGESVRLIGGLVAVAAYAVYFWRVFRSNRGNKVIECGSMALIVLMALVLLTQLGDLPDWLFASLVILLVLLCVSTLFFVGQRAFRAVRRRPRQ